MTQQKMTYSQIAGMNLKRILKKRKITQEEFAYDFGVDVRTIRRWIKDGIGSTDVVAYVADELNISFWDMFSTEDDVPSVLYDLYFKQFIGHFLSL